MTTYIMVDGKYKEGRIQPRLKEPPPLSNRCVFCGISQRETRKRFHLATCRSPSSNRYADLRLPMCWECIQARSIEVTYEGRLADEIQYIDPVRSLPGVEITLTWEL